MHLRVMKLQRRFCGDVLGEGNEVFTHQQLASAESYFQREVNSLAFLACPT